jgi:hypothetical protein
MAEYECSYQHAEGANQLRQVLDGKISTELLTQLTQRFTDQKVGVLEALKAGGHISQPLMRANNLAGITRIPQVVVFNNSYFVVETDKTLSGPLSHLCMPDADTSKDWAATAVEWADAELLRQSLSFLPEKQEA